MTQELRRFLGVFDAVVIGLGSMMGAGIFVALAPAAGAAGSGLLPALGVAAVVAYCNAMASARLAARHPASGGTYVYGRERLGPFWGYLAGWAFVVGKTASCAAMALTVGAYLWPDQAHAVAVAAVVAVVAATADVRGAIGFSSFGVLVYYGIANASAWTLGRSHRALAAVGLAGCAVLAFALPPASVLAGMGVLAAGVVAYAVTRGRPVRPRP
ncbi:amino acid permease [Streptomyces sp. NPDC003027]